LKLAPEFIDFIQGEKTYEKEVVKKTGAQGKFRLFFTLSG